MGGQGQSLVIAGFFQNSHGAFLVTSESPQEKVLVHLMFSQAAALGRSRLADRRYVARTLFSTS
jgi:hypothetical protein